MYCTALRHYSTLMNVIRHSEQPLAEKVESRHSVHLVDGVARRVGLVVWDLNIKLVLLVHKESPVMPICKSDQQIKIILSSDHIFTKNQTTN